MEKNRETCPTCGAITSSYTFTFSYLDAKLLLAMANEVRSKSGTMGFTDANKIHIPSLNVPSNVSKRMTISSKLGLIAKYIVAGHQKLGIWVITSRGWAALRGESVPAKVSVYRKNITARYEEMTTITLALKSYPDSKFNPVEWYEFLTKGQ